MGADRFSTATRLRTLGAQAAARVYRAQSRRVRTPRKGRLTGRAALLALVLCSLVVALAYPTRQYVTQRSEIADQKRQAERTRDEVDKLKELRARWRDPAFVEQQARRHLHFVRPDERGYTLPDGTADTGPRRDRGPANRAWYENMWDAVDAVDAAEAADSADAADVSGRADANIGADGHRPSTAAR